MNQELRESLLAFLDADTANFSYGKLQDCKQIIAAGAFAETSENHYIFIFRDPYESQPTYQGILFLYKNLDLKTPLEILFSTQPKTAQRAEIFICTAAYFLKNKEQNSLDINLDNKSIYMDLSHRLLLHSLNESKQKKNLEQFNFQISSQQIQAMEIALKDTGKSRHSVNLKDQLKILQTPSKSASSQSEFKLSIGKLALVLEVDNALGKLPRFIPMIITIKKNGKQSVLKPAVPSQCHKYKLGDEPPLLVDFLEQRCRLSNKNRRDPLGMEALNKIYFDKLATLLLEMKDDVTFCQLENDREEKIYHPLKKIVFKKVSVKFAPYAIEENLGIYLVFHTPQGEEFTAGLDYRIFEVNEDTFYLFFELREDTFHFAVPLNPNDFTLFFRFLNQVRKFAMKDFPTLRKSLLKIQSQALLIEATPLPLFRLKFLPTPIIKILEGDIGNLENRHIELEFDYQNEKNKYLKSHPDTRLVEVEKNSHFETLCYLLLKQDPLLKIIDKNSHSSDHPTEHAFLFENAGELEWLIERGSFYLDKEFKIYSSKRKQYIRYTGSRLEISLHPGTKWLDFKAFLKNDVSGETFDIKHVDLATGSVHDNSGALHLVKKEELERLAAIFKYAEKHGDLFRIPAGNYFLIHKLYDRRMENIPQVKDRLIAFEKLESYKKDREYNLSPNFQGTLRKYQKAGFSWLHFLQEYNLSGCLADDMGLGKTVQTLALLQTLKDQGQLKTSLLVVPVSAIPVWEGEIIKFTPTLRSYCHIGLNREKNRNAWKDCDLVITSYATLRNDIAGFMNFQFDYIILDESQNIKNLAAQTTKAVKIIKARHHLALSGTPIENNSLELWSLFDFLLPGFLGTQQYFKQEWAIPIEKHKDIAKAQTLRQMVYPFMLRRKKEDVEAELPEKTEIVESLSMDREQEQLYASIAKHYSDAINREIDNKGVSRSSVKILEGMLRLRQVCLFPQLLNEENAHIPSVKFDHFKGMLEDILAEGHKVLVFSQFVKVLTILRKYFEAEGLKYSYLDGKVPLESRKTAIDAFQEDKNTGVFLLSLKAGGVALNLTAADYVIIFDPWWNPAVEAQAIDRSHRIGQTRKVFVYRMVVKNSIEEKMLTLQEQKKQLVDQLITTETRGFKNLEKNDVLKLFSFHNTGD